MAWVLAPQWHFVSSIWLSGSVWCSKFIWSKGIQRDGDWLWLPARSEDLMCIQSKLSLVETERENKPILTAGKTRRFSCIGAWKRVRIKFPEVWWRKLLWFSKTTPRHACIGWFTTKDWMISWGITIDTQCILCRLRTESKDGCSFLKMIWRTLMLWCLIKNPKNHWEDVLGWISV